jgi:hypothetical protein
MKRLIAIAFLGLGALTVSAGSAQAGWFFHNHHCHCSVKIHCRQYNAFSMPCCDNPAGGGDGCGPGGCGVHPGFGYAGYTHGHVAQGIVPGSPAQGALAGPVTGSPGSPPTVSNPSAQAPGATPRVWSAPAPYGRMPSGGAPVLHPGFQGGLPPANGFIGFAPQNGGVR